MVQDDALERRPCVSNDSKDGTETNRLRGMFCNTSLVVGLGYLLMKGSYQPQLLSPPLELMDLRLIYSHCTHSRADIRSKSYHFPIPFLFPAGRQRVDDWV